jgi:hypothetical protein
VAILLVRQPLPALPEFLFFIPPTTPQTKSHFVDAVRRKFAQESIICYVFVHPAWVVETTTPDPVPSISLWAARRGLANYPGRQCIVLFSAENRSGIMLARRTVEQRDDSRLALGPLEIMKEGGEYEGLLVGLLPQQGTRQ